MRAGIAIAALLGVAGFSVAACAQAPLANNFGPTPVYQNVGVPAGPVSGIRSTIENRVRTTLDPTAELGDPFTLKGYLFGDNEPAINFGGWFQTGYHSQDNGLFNDRPDDVQIQQAWLFAEKEAVAGESPLGFRADIMYGIDGQDTQAFGNNPGEWDFQNGFDHGIQSWAIPQLYAELAVGEWNIKGGHFYTLVGYEVVTAPDNFFYSHAITFFNTEPFTHTGVVASRDIGEDMTFYGGWTAGWDTGFNQNDGGSNWLGGLSMQLTENASLTYISTAGDFGARGEDAYSHSFVFDTQLTDKLNWVVQSDLLRVGSTGEDNVGLNQYLIYSATDRIGVGARVEWWKGDALTGFTPFGSTQADLGTGSLSYYEATFGVNYRTTANSIIRPEVRFDWSPAANINETTYAIDSILTF